MHRSVVSQVKSIWCRASAREGFFFGGSDGTGDTDVHVAPVSHVHPSAVVHSWAISGSEGPNSYSRCPDSDYGFQKAHIDGVSVPKKKQQGIFRAQ